MKSLYVETRTAASRRQTAARGVARITLAFVFAWHGLVPKLVFRHEDEVAPLRDAGVPESLLDPLVTAAGIAELALAACLVLLWRRRWPSVVALAAIAILTAGVVAVSPRYLRHAFNPLTLNLAVAALAAIDLALLARTTHDGPRAPPEDNR